MPRDPGATPIQGPDSGGNPLPVTTVNPANNQVDLEQVLGIAIVVAGAGVMMVGARDGNNNPLVAIQQGEAVNGLLSTPTSSSPSTVASAANAAAVITFAAVAGQRNRLTALSYQYNGANTAQTLTIQDGATTVFQTLVPASSTTLLTAVMPAGGIQTAINSAMTITLPAGGAGISGILNAAKQTW